MPQIPIDPRYKLLMKYDIRPDHYETYYRFILGEFIPGVQNLGLYSFMAWHIAYGEYPMRQIEFVTDSLDTVYQVFGSTQWQELETRLKAYILNYERKVVEFHDRFQF
jgi:hypothetical protein